MRLIHVFVDNARYHKADVVKEWLAAARRRIALHFHSALLSPSRSHRTVVGLDARKHHLQPGIQDLQGIPARDSKIPPAHRAQRLEALLRQDSQTILGLSIAPIFASRLAGVYNEASKHIFKNSFLRSVGSAL